MANFHNAIADARAVIGIPGQNLPGGQDQKFEAVVTAIEALAAEFADLRTKTIAEIDELKDQLADARSDD